MDVDFLFGQAGPPIVAKFVRRSQQFMVTYDGSGSIGKDCAYAYGGAVSSQAQWSAFSETWRIILDRQNLAYFKMSEAMGVYGEFLAKWTEWGSDYKPRRDALLNELAGLKKRYALTVVGSGVATRDGSPLKPSGKTVAVKTDVFKDAVQQLLGGLPPDAMVHFMCDIELDAEESYRGWIQSLASNDVPSTVKVTGIAFFDDKYTIPLQFADMVAWLARQVLDRGIHRGPESEKNPLYDLMMEGSVGGIAVVG